MSLFKTKRTIQLGTEQAENMTSNQRPISRSSKWSIPCCSNLTLGRGGAIQLPDDSDLEDDEYNQPDFTSHNQNIVGRMPIEHSPNAFLQNQTDNTARILSRNPFARASSEDPSEQNQQKDVTIINNEQGQSTITVERFESETTGDEELSNFTRSSFTRYENESDWTEPYKDDDQEECNSNIEGFQIQEDALNADEHLDTQNTISDLENTNKDTEAIAENHHPAVEEKVPQIEEEVLHLLPLPRLSKEIPPTLIHKIPSMYGDKPVTSALQSTSESSNRVSRFSMTEEDYLAMKKKEQEEKRKSLSSFVAVPKLENEQPSTSSTSMNNDESQNTLATEIEVTQLEAVSQDPLSSTDSQSQIKQQPAQKKERRASIVSSAAHSLLGDKYDDITEKLAFIKKNIIMNSDSDDEDDQVDNAESMLKKIEESKLIKTNSHESGSEQRPQTLHRRTSSLMDVAPTIARFINHINGTHTEDAATVQLSSSQSSTSSFSPSSLFSALAGPIPEPSSSTLKKKELVAAREESNEKKTIQEVEEEEDDEELFDFTKVIKIGQNVKTFSEGVVGEGLRMFNDVATRMKTELQQQEEEILKQQEHQPPTTLNTSASTESTVNNEDEWMHNYL